MQKTIEKKLLPVELPGAKHEVRSEILVISPEVAAAWLDQNKINRNPRSTIVTKYARDMKEGQWRLTFDPIRFDIANELLDGQHRLMACVKAERPFTSLVIYGLPTEMRDVIDTGASRSVGDVLQFHGIGSANHVSAVARWIIAAKSGQSNRKRGSDSVQTIMDVIKRHPGIGASVNVAAFGTKSPSPSLLAFLHYAGSHLIGIPETSDSFVNVFKSGIPSRNGCPAHKLREFVVHAKGTRQVLRPAERWDSMVHVWNVFARGDEMQRLKWPNNVTMDGLDLDQL